MNGAACDEAGGEFATAGSVPGSFRFEDLAMARFLGERKCGLSRVCS